jgi:hypothetical protein
MTAPNARVAAVPAKNSLVRRLVSLSPIIVCLNPRYWRWCGLYDGDGKNVSANQGKFTGAVSIAAARRRLRWPGSKV